MYASYYTFYYNLIQLHLEWKYKKYTLTCTPFFYAIIKNNEIKYYILYNTLEMVPCNGL